MWKDMEGSIIFYVLQFLLRHDLHTVPYHDIPESLSGIPQTYRIAWVSPQRSEFRRRSAANAVKSAPEAATVSSFRVGRAVVHRISRMVFEAKVWFIKHMS